MCPVTQVLSLIQLANHAAIILLILELHFECEACEPAIVAVFRAGQIIMAPGRWVPQVNLMGI